MKPDLFDRSTAPSEEFKVVDQSQPADGPASTQPARKLCILTQYFPPEMGAPQARLSELGERLIDLGWKVEALTALPNYPTGQVFADYNPRQPIVEQVGRIRTVRVPLYAAKTGFRKRLRSYFSFVASACRHGPRLCTRPDLLYVESPPLFIGYAARYLSWKWNCPYVLNISDLWPDSAVHMGVVKPGVATRLAGRLERKLYRRAAAVTGQSEEIVRAVQARSPQTPTALITNGVAPERFGRDKADAVARQLLGDEPGPIFLFAGLLGLAQGLDQLLDLAAALPDDVPGRIVLVGEGPVREHLIERIETESIHRVRIVPSQPRERIAALLGAADVALVSLGMSIPGAVPSKIYEAMASSLPILLIADGESASRVQQAGCGLAVPPGRLDRALDAFGKLARDASLREQMGLAGRQAAETTYNRRRIAAKLDRFLAGLCRGADASLAYRIAKRTFDLTCSGTALVLLSPLLLVVAVLVRATSRGPALFRQQRVGRGFKPFTILKFRTMAHRAGNHGDQFTVSHDPRITRFGKFLRKTKIDELPQLFNVVKGDMSLVGPRPEVPRYVDEFRDQYARLLTVRPGVTSLASIEYRDESAVLAAADDSQHQYVSVVLPKKIQLDTFYLDRATFWFDLKVILSTLLKIVRY